MATLYIRPATCSLAAHIALREAGEPFDLVFVDLATKKTADGGDYTAIAPKGQVPALALGDGVLLTEGPAIGQYVADSSPAAGLLPPVGDLHRYQVLEWLNFGSAELHKAVGQLFMPNIPDAARPGMVAQAEAKLGIVEAHLAGREWLTDAGYSLADILLFVVASWMPMIGIDPARYPNIGRLSGAVAGRPAVLAALKAEGLIS